MIIKIKITAMILLLTAFTFIACGGSSSGSDDSAYSMDTLPSKFMVDIPDSISGATMARKDVLKTMLKTRSKAEASIGCEMMRDMTGMMKSMSGMIGFETILTDAAIEQNGIPADEAPHDCTITLTRGMIDAIAAIFPDDTAGNAEMESFIGESISITVTYSDNGTGTYKYSATSIMEGSEITIYWSEDKKNTKIEMPVTDDSGITEIGSMIFVYNDTEKLMTMSFVIDMEGSPYKMDMSLKEQGEGALFFSNIDYMGSIFRIEGYADDNGGYINYTSISSDFGSYTYTETFDANGNTITGDGSYESVYTDASGDGDISDLQNNIGFSITTALPDGEYIVLNTSSFDGTTIDQSEVVGYGVVSAGKLVIQDIGGDVYNILESTGTVYLYKATGNFMGESAPTFSTTANPVVL